MLLPAKTCFKFKLWKNYENEPDWSYVYLKTRKKKGNNVYYYEAEVFEWFQRSGHNHRETIMSSTQINKILSEFSGTKYSRYTKKEFAYFDASEWDFVVAKILLTK